MPEQKKRSRDEGQERVGSLWAIRLCLAVAIGVGTYLAWVSLTGAAVAGCGPTSDCHQVLNSRWAYWFGVPVSLGALLVYLTSVTASFWLRPGVPAATQRKAWTILVPSAALIIGSALWFAFLQLAVIKAICPYCMTAHACGVLAAVLILFAAPFRRAIGREQNAQGRVSIPPALAIRLMVLALGGLGVLVGGQVLYQKMAVSVTSVPALTNATALVSKAPTKRTFEIYDGLFSFNLYEVPLIGKPEAPHVFVSLFDYTCHHCRLMHGQLMEAYQAFSNDLAIVSLPMPLDSACNSNITQTPKPHADSCDYARIGLAVWRADRSRMHDFEEWIFTPATPPPLADVRQYAGQLVGVEKFVQAWQSEWINQQLQRDITIYSTNYIHFRNGSMPQLVIGNKLVAGTFRSAEDLFKVLGQEFGLQRGAGLSAK